MTDVRRPTFRPPMPFVTWTLAVLNAVVWLAIMATGRDNSPVVSALALTPMGVCELSNGIPVTGTDAAHCTVSKGTWFPGIWDGGLWQLLTSAIVHIAPLHIAMNLFVLCVIGPQLERLVGWARFLLLYLLAALGSSAMVLLLSDPTVTTLGASGANFGVFGALLVQSLRVRADLRSILSWLLLTVVALVPTAADVSWEGHLGGLLTGIAVMAVLGRRPRPRVRVENPA